MVGPERKREAVVHVRQELEVSERRACRASNNREARNDTVGASQARMRR